MANAEQTQPAATGKAVTLSSLGVTPNFEEAYRPIKSFPLA